MRPGTRTREPLRGFIAWFALVAPWVALTAWFVHPLLDVLLLWLALGGSSLAEHARRHRGVGWTR